MAKITNIGDSNMRDALKMLIEHSQSYIDYAKEKLKTIQDIDAKIEFLEELRHKYLSEDVYFNAEIREASGVVTNGSQISEGFDKWCDLQIDYLRKKSKTKITDKKSYLWISDKNEITQLFDLLIKKYKLISADNNLDDFITVFSNSKLSLIKPIMWHDNNASEVLYFVRRLIETNQVENNSQKMDYKKLETCFVNSSSQRFKVNWKQLNNTLEVNLSKNKQSIIDSILSEF